MFLFPGLVQKPKIPIAAGMPTITLLPPAGGNHPDYMFFSAIQHVKIISAAKLFFV
jgi:hypothetical protein